LGCLSTSVAKAKISQRKAKNMPYYLLQIAYTSKGFAALVKKPQNRMETLRPVFENLGGSIQ
jgi:uncharacterized protein with GYD domain